MGERASTTDGWVGGQRAISELARLGLWLSVGCGPQEWGKGEPEREGAAKSDCTAAARVRMDGMGKDYFGSSEMSKPGDVPGPWNSPNGRA